MISVIAALLINTIIVPGFHERKILTASDAITAAHEQWVTQAPQAGNVDAWRHEFIAKHDHEVWILWSRARSLRIRLSAKTGRILDGVVID